MTDSVLLLLLLLMLQILLLEAAKSVTNERICDTDFTDIQSRWLQAPVVLLATPHSKLKIDDQGLYNITIKVKKSLNKLRWKLKLRIPVTVGPFKDGNRDKTRCLMNIRLGRKYILFLDPTNDPLHFKVKYFPVTSSRSKLRKIRRIRCSDCVKAPVITRLRKTIEKDEDDGKMMLVIRCKAAARPPAIFHWLKDGKKLTKTETDARRGLSIRYTRRSSRIRIRRASEEDAGTYTCVARNLKGTVQKSETVAAASLAPTEKPQMEAYFENCPQPSDADPYCLNGGRCIQTRWTASEKICICRGEYFGEKCTLTLANNPILEKEKARYVDRIMTVGA